MDPEDDKWISDKWIDDDWSDEAWKASCRETAEEDPVPEEFTPTEKFSPVKGIRDKNGVEFTLDCEVIVRYDPDRAPAHRGRVVGIGDVALPGEPVLKVRPHGSAYVETVGSRCCEVHEFDLNKWAECESQVEEAQHVLGRKSRDIRFGGEYFEEAQREIIKLYSRPKDWVRFLSYEDSIMSGGGYGGKSSVASSIKIAKHNKLLNDVDSYKITAQGRYEGAMLQKNGTKEINKIRRILSD